MFFQMHGESIGFFCNSLDDIGLAYTCTAHNKQLVLVAVLLGVHAIHINLIIKNRADLYL